MHTVATRAGLFWVNLLRVAFLTAETNMSATPASQKTIALVVRHNTAGIEQSVGGLLSYLQGAGYRVVLETETAAHLAMPGIEAMNATQIGETASAAIVMGGDGTMLGIARQLAPYDVPLIGINQGRLGFMTDIPIERMIPVLDELLNGKSKAEKRTLLEARVMRAGAMIASGLAVNDVVVARGAGAGMVELKVSVDGHFM
jgi:NAD+ kinase